MTGQNKSLMQCLGEFAGHIVKAIKQPADSNTTTVRHETSEEQQGNVVLRRTVIEEVEMPADATDGENNTCS
jgi:hypothetical protein